MDRRGNCPSWYDGNCSPWSWIAFTSLVFITLCFRGSFRRSCVGLWACPRTCLRLGTWSLVSFRGFGGFRRFVFGLGRFGCSLAWLASSRNLFDAAWVARSCPFRFSLDGLEEISLGASEAPPFSFWSSQLFRRFCQLSPSLRACSLNSSISQPSYTTSASPSSSPLLWDQESSSMVWDNYQDKT